MDVDRQCGQAIGKFSSADEERCYSAPTLSSDRTVVGHFMGVCCDAWRCIKGSGFDITLRQAQDKIQGDSRG